MIAVTTATPKVVSRINFRFLASKVSRSNTLHPDFDDELPALSEVFSLLSVSEVIRIQFLAAKENT